MGQHLGHVKASNALRTYLEMNGVKPEDCSEYEFIAHGPLFPEQADMEAHKGPRDIVAALEKHLADSLRAAGYTVLNTVNSNKPLHDALWTTVRDAFAKYFAKLREN